MLVTWRRTVEIRTDDVGQVCRRWGNTRRRGRGGVRFGRRAGLRRPLGRLVDQDTQNHNDNWGEAKNESSLLPPLLLLVSYLLQAALVLSDSFSLWTWHDQSR